MAKIDRIENDLTAEIGAFVRAYLPVLRRQVAEDIRPEIEAEIRRKIEEEERLNGGLLLNAKRAAIRLGIGDTTLTRWLAEGLIPAPREIGKSEWWIAVELEEAVRKMPVAKRYRRQTA